MGRGIASRHRTNLSPVGGLFRLGHLDSCARSTPSTFFDKSTTALKFTLKLSDVFVICRIDGNFDSPNSKRILIYGVSERQL